MADDGTGYAMDFTAMADRVLARVRIGDTEQCYLIEFDIAAAMDLARQLDRALDNAVLAAHGAEEPDIPPRISETPTPRR